VEWNEIRFLRVLLTDSWKIVCFVWLDNWHCCILFNSIRPMYFGPILRLMNGQNKLVLRWGSYIATMVSSSERKSAERQIFFSLGTSLLGWKANPNERPPLTVEYFSQRLLDARCQKRYRLGGARPPNVCTHLPAVLVSGGGCPGWRGWCRGPFLFVATAATKTLNTAFSEGIYFFGLPVEFAM